MIKTKKHINNNIENIRKNLLKPLNIQQPINLLDDDRIIIDLNNNLIINYINSDNSDNIDNIGNTYNSDVKIKKLNDTKKTVKKMVMSIVKTKKQSKLSKNKDNFVINQKKVIYKFLELLQIDYKKSKDSNYNVKFYIINDGIVYPMILSGHINDMDIKFDINVNDNYLNPMSLNIESLNNSEYTGYLASIHKFDQNDVMSLLYNNNLIPEKFKVINQFPYSGSQLVKTSLKLAYILKIRQISITDAASIDCNNYRSIDLSSIKIIEKGFGFYNKFGFEYMPRLDRKLLNSPTKIKNEIEIIRKCFRTYTLVDIIDACKNIISEIRNFKNNSNNKDYTIFKVENNNFISNKLLSNTLNTKLDNIISTLNNLITIFNNITKSPYNIPLTSPFYSIVENISNNHKLNCQIYNNIFLSIEEQFYNIYNYFTDIYVCVNIKHINNDIIDNEVKLKIINNIKNNKGISIKSINEISKKNIFGFNLDNLNVIEKIDKYNDDIMIFGNGNSNNGGGINNIFDTLTNIRYLPLKIKNLQQVYKKYNKVDKNIELNNFALNFYINLNTDLSLLKPYFNYKPINNDKFINKDIEKIYNENIDNKLCGLYCLSNILSINKFDFNNKNINPMQKLNINYSKLFNYINKINKSENINNNKKVNIGLIYGNIVYDIPLFYVDDNLKIYGFNINSSLYNIIDKDVENIDINRNLYIFYNNNNNMVYMGVYSKYTNLVYLYNIIIKIYEILKNTFSKNTFTKNKKYEKNDNIKININYFLEKDMQEEINYLNQILFDVIKNINLDDKISNKLSNKYISTEFPIINKELLDLYKNHYNTVENTLLSMKNIKIKDELLPKLKYLLDLLEYMYDNNSSKSDRKSDKNSYNNYDIYTATIDNKISCMNLVNNKYKINQNNPLSKPDIKNLITNIQNIIDILNKFDEKIDNLYEFIKFIEKSDENILSLMKLFKIMVGDFENIIYNCNILYLYDKKNKQLEQISLGYEKKSNGKILKFVNTYLLTNLYNHLDLMYITIKI